jgi:hypothetical protein
MVRKKAAGKPTSKKRPPAKKKLPTRKSVALSTSAKLKHGDPTSAAELSALFEATQQVEDKQRDVALAKGAPTVELIRPRRRYGLWAALLIVIVVAGGYIWLRARLSGSLVPEEGVLAVTGAYCRCGNPARQSRSAAHQGTEPRRHGIWRGVCDGSRPRLPD